MHPRKRLEIGWRDLASALLGRGLLRDAPTLTRCLERRWSPEGRGLVCFSVRTGLDLFLEVASLPPGSEVLLSALNVPDMWAIIEDHGLVPVPVEFDPVAGLPTRSDLEGKRTPRTRALLVAQLFGGRGPLGPHVQFAREHGLLLLEDCAQAFTGLDYTGHPEADVSFFSFGPIKTATALGGALLRVRDRRVRGEMAAIAARYPQQSAFAFRTRVLKYAALKLLSAPALFGLFAALVRSLGQSHGRDLDGVIQGSVRSFGAHTLRERWRRRPSLALLVLLERRLVTFDRHHLDKRAATGEALRAALRGRIPVWGGGLPHRTHWVFPVEVSDSTETRRALAGVGIDSAHRATLSVPAAATHLRRALDDVIYVPCHPELPSSARERMVEILTREVCEAASRPSR